MQAHIVLSRARILLEDADSTRWPLPELLLYLSDAQREIALQKPNAVTVTKTIDLVAGTKQSHDDLALIRVIRNEEGKAVTPIARESVDAVMPGWGDPSVLPYSAQVDHMIQDIMDPQTFYVVPGNDGTGTLECIFAVLPDNIADAASPFAIESYTQELPTRDIYQNALLDYVLYRAYSKDSSDPSNANRAMAHWNQFAQAIGIKQQAEQVARIATSGKTE